MTGLAPTTDSFAFLATTGGDDLGSLWRIELLHPAVVHFAVALVVVGSLFWFLGCAAQRRPALTAFRVAGPTTLCLALLASWAAVQSGFWADSVVGRHLYDPRPLKDHENLGLAMAWTLTAAVLMDFTRYPKAIPRTFRRWLAVPVALLLLVTNALLAFAAHLGASLVYQQGAGVQWPPGTGPH